MAPKPGPWADKDWLADQLRRHGTISRVAAVNECHRQTIENWSRKHGLTSVQTAVRQSTNTTGERPGVSIDGDTATLVSKANPRGTDTQTPDELMRQHGLDPSQWTYQATVNAWDALTGEGGVTTLSQIKLVCRRRPEIALIAPVRTDGWRPPKTRRRRPTMQRPELGVLCGDAHHPDIEPGLHQAMCRMLADTEPDFGIDFGDGLNNPTLSRWGTNPAHADSVEACLNGEYRSWRDRLAASPRTRWKRLPGNHDHYIRRMQLERTAALYGLRQAWADDEEPPEHPVLDIGFLLRLDELGVEMVRPPADGEYHHAQVKIAPGLIGSHGTKAGEGGGAKKNAPRLECSYVQGHDHKQVLQYATRYDDDRRAGDRLFGSIGTLARRDLGYSEFADAQQGFATVTIWPDGRWHVELARWDAGELVWRDRRY